MSTLQQNLADVILREAAGMRSRDAGTVQPDADVPLTVGTVLGLVTAAGVYRRRLATATDGSQVARAVLGEIVWPGAQSVKALVFARDIAVNVRGLEYDTASALTQLGAIGVEITSRPASGLSWDARAVTFDGMSINVAI